MRVGTIGLAALFVLIWASAFNAARIIALDAPPLWALALRFAITVPLLMLLVSGTKAPLPSRADAPRVVAMGVFGIGGYLAFCWVASAHLPSGMVALVSATAPLFVALGECLFLGARLPALGWLGLALGWAGVAILGLGRSGMELNSTEVFGLGLGLLGALCQAVGLLALAPARGRLNLWSANMVQTGAAMLVVLVLAGWLEDPPGLQHGAAVWAAFLWCVLVVGLVGYSLYVVMLRRMPASSAAALQLLAPPVAAVLGWALLGEALGPMDLLGGGVTLLGLLLLLRARRVG